MYCVKSKLSLYFILMAGIAQLVRALDCDSRCRRFKSGCPPHLNKLFKFQQFVFIGFLFVLSCSTKHEYPEDPLVGILKRQGRFGDTKLHTKKTSQTDNVRKNFLHIHNFIKKEYGIEKYRPNQLIVSKSKNNQKLQVILIDDSIQINNFIVNEKNQIKGQKGIPAELRNFLNRLKNINQ